MVGAGGSICGRCRTAISFDTEICPNCGFSFGKVSGTPDLAQAGDEGGQAPRRPSALEVLQTDWLEIGSLGLFACIPSGLLMLMIAYGKGGTVGGAIAFILVVTCIVAGLPWNVGVGLAWKWLADALDQPAWLGSTSNQDTGLAVVFWSSVAGQFINGAIVGWLIARTRRRRRH